jgi:transcription elongation GreA/GreB family factor
MKEQWGRYAVLNFGLVTESLQRAKVESKKKPRDVIFNDRVDFSNLQDAETRNGDCSPS